MPLAIAQHTLYLLTMLLHLFQSTLAQCCAGLRNAVRAALPQSYAAALRHALQMVQIHGWSFLWRGSSLLWPRCFAFAVVRFSMEPLFARPYVRLGWCGVLGVAMCV
jgi:hypothetical protein